MVRRLVKNALKKPTLKNALPPFINAKLVVDELAEHSGFIRWSFKRIILPLAIFYVAAGFLLGEHVLGSLLMGIVVFLYANFLPDLDTFFPHANDKSNKVSAVRKRIALFFAPLIIYYILSGKQKSWDLGKDKPFHNTRALLEFSVFLFILGSLLYFSFLKAFFFTLFGFCGYCIHLIIDGRIIIIKLK
ncbi:MAG: hypothetical protein Q7K34_01890, partial [archaeon]|nr:hypothetical protein [archaeon]